MDILRKDAPLAQQPIAEHAAGLFTGFVPEDEIKEKATIERDLQRMFEEIANKNKERRAAQGCKPIPRRPDWRDHL